MQIKHLWISKYKNLENVKFKFESDLITLLVGQNGLGKSNLLEAVAIIFSNLDLAEKEEEFTTEPFKNFFNFRIWYTCKEIDIRIKAEREILSIYVKNSAEPKDKFVAISFAQFKKKRKELIPDYIIGYYSGENSRIGEFFVRHASQRINNLKKRGSDKNFPALGRMFFTEKDCSHLVLFTLWVYKNHEKFAPKIHQLLNQFIKIEKSSVIQISFCNPEFSKGYPKQNADDLLSNIQSNVLNPFWGITGKIDRLLNIMFDNHTAHSIPRSFEDESFDKNSGKTGFIFFEHLDFDSLCGELAAEFEDPVYLFDALHAAYQLGIVYKIDGVISKNGVKETHSFHELSEGERQLMTVLGLVLITGKDDCLFLLDEPDTHLNPKWQRQYAQLLHEFNRNIDNNKNHSHIIVCTHSPLIVQATEDPDIFLFKRDSNGEVKAVFNDFKIQNWRIDQVLESEYFEFESSRAPQLDEFMKLREALLSKPELTNEDIKKLSEVEIQIGILPTGETLNDFRAMHLIRSIAKDVNK